MAISDSPNVPIVFDNIVYALQRAGGVSRVWAEITNQHADHARFIERTESHRNIYRREQALKHIDADHNLPLLVARYVNFRRNCFPEPFIFHSSYYRINHSSYSLNVTTIHDLIYEKFGSGLGCHLHLRQKMQALRASQCIVCVSDHTRVDLLKFYPFCIDKNVVVIPNGVREYSVAGSLRDQKDTSGSVLQNVINQPFFLYVGNRGACKGFDRIHVALDFLPRNYFCIVVGDSFSSSETAVISHHGHQARVINMGKIDDNVLNKLYLHASFLFFPSLYEGFGIPPLEAMQAGCPVLASNRSSVPEVVGDAGLLFDPDDNLSVRQAIDSILSKDVRSTLIEAGRERAKMFPWQSARDAYARLYADILNSC